MGATGTGKSKLFIDLSAMFSGEVVNSDKIQVYRGLDITTNKIPVVERSGSNSFVHALLLERYDSRQRRVTGEEVERLRHRCCFLWVHVEAAVLAWHLDRRVDEMVQELEWYFAAEGEAEQHPGLGKSIGVPGEDDGDRRRRRRIHVVPTSIRVD